MNRTISQVLWSWAIKISSGWTHTASAPGLAWGGATHIETPSAAERARSSRTRSGARGGRVRGAPERSAWSTSSRVGIGRPRPAASGGARERGLPSRGLTDRDVGAEPGGGDARPGGATSSGRRRGWRRRGRGPPARGRLARRRMYPRARGRRHDAPVRRRGGRGRHALPRALEHADGRGVQARRRARRGQARVSSTGARPSVSPRAPPSRAASRSPAILKIIRRAASNARLATARRSLRDAIPSRRARRTMRASPPRVARAPPRTPSGPASSTGAIAQLDYFLVVGSRRTPAASRLARSVSSLAHLPPSLSLPPVPFAPHPLSGRVLRLRAPEDGPFPPGAPARRRSSSFTRRTGVNERFEATETHETNPRGRYRVNDLLVSCLIRPRRFPGMALNVKMHTLRAEARELTPWQKNLVSGGMTMAGRVARSLLGDVRRRARFRRVVLRRLLRDGDARGVAAPAPPTSRPGSVSHSRARPPAGPSSSWTTISARRAPGASPRRPPSPRRCRLCRTRGASLGARRWGRWRRVPWSPAWARRR